MKMRHTITQENSEKGTRQAQMRRRQGVEVEGQTSTTVAAAVGANQIWRAQIPRSRETVWVQITWLSHPIQHSCSRLRLGQPFLSLGSA